MHISNWLGQANTDTFTRVPISDELRQVATNTSTLPCLNFEWHKVGLTTPYHNAPSVPSGKARQVARARQKFTERNH